MPARPYDPTAPGRRHLVPSLPRPIAGAADTAPAHPLPPPPAVPEGGREQTHAAAVALLRDEVSFHRLVAVAEVLESDRARVIELWADRYQEVFGPRPFFQPTEFRAFFGSELLAMTTALRSHDPDALVQALSTSGHELAAMGAPFSELVCSIHLFEESCLECLRGRVADDELSLLRSLDCLSHVRIAVLADAYVSEREQVHSQREAALEREIARYHRDSQARAAFGGLVGRSAAMQILYGRLEIAATSEAPVLLVGESGTGKELAARALHLRSGRRQGPFVPVNCAALTPSLLESELFGHRRGSFTGADADTPGLLRYADGGTLFLDEVTEMSPEGQAKLLRAIQEKAVRPVGELKEFKTDFRVVASTNREPETAVRQGRLRPDLLYRLRTFLVEMPPLRRRIDDIPLLARAIFERSGLGHLSISSTALARLRSHPWPGNVRELEAVLLAAAAAAPHGRVRVIDLPRPSALASNGPDEGGSEPVPTVREAEERLIERALRLTEGNKLRAAEILGVSRKWLYSRLGKAGRS